MSATRTCPSRFCPVCGGAITHESFADVATIPPDVAPMAVDADPEARARMLQRLKEAAPNFFQWDEDTWGDWIDGMPVEEFYEYVRMDPREIASFLAEHGAKA